MTNAEFIVALKEDLTEGIRTAVKEETKGLKEDLKTVLKEDLTGEIRTAVKEETKGLKEDLKTTLKEDLTEEIRTTVKEELKATNKRLDKLETRVQKMDVKFGIELGQLRCQVGDLQEDVKYLKEQPQYADTRISFLEQHQEITDKRLDILESKRA